MGSSGRTLRALIAVSLAVPVALGPASAVSHASSDGGGGAACAQVSPAPGSTPTTSGGTQHPLTERVQGPDSGFDIRTFRISSVEDSPGSWSALVAMTVSGSPVPPQGYSGIWEVDWTSNGQQFFTGYEVDGLPDGLIPPSANQGLGYQQVTWHL